MRVVVTGAGGFIGGALVRALRRRGDEVYPVVRRPPSTGEVGINLSRWEIDSSRVAGGSLEAIDAAVHLAGAAITTRWSPKRLEEIRSSRIAVGNLLARALACLERPPAVLVSGSAVGFYGDRGDEVLDETSPQGTGVLADMCRSWEESVTPAVERGIRVVTVRTGIVLGGAGGASGGILHAELPVFRLGLGARLGDGSQWTSWVSLDDEVAAILRAIDDTQLTGPVNATAPNPVRNGELTDAIAHALGRRARLAVPAAVLRLALGRGAADELLLASQRVLPKKLTGAGFVHTHAELEGALSAALAPQHAI
ncbi:MAG: TIGR01777 family oxidoreductase [Acidimicrobiales bacterium]